MATRFTDLDAEGFPQQGPSTDIGRAQRNNDLNSSSNNASSNISGNGFYKYNAEHVLKNYFKDTDTFNFKYGLEFGLNSNLNSNSTQNSLMNLDEDPTILGFDIVILNNSPLFNDIDSFFDFADSKSLKQVTNKRNIYQDFITQFSKFFNVDDRNRGEFKVDNKFNSFKTHYLNGVSGLDKLVHYTGIGNERKRQMTDFGIDKLTFNLSEDIGLNSAYLAAAYRNLIYTKIDGRQIIPENLLRFDMVIILSEIRNFNRVSNAASKVNKDSGANLIKVFNDNISRHIFTLYDCQLDFNKYSFGDNIKQGGFGASVPGVSEGITFDVIYKYVGSEMEKFNFHPGSVDPDRSIIDEGKYINDQRKDPTSFQINTDTDSNINQETDAVNADKFPNRVIDLRYQMNTLNNSNDDKDYQFDFPMLNAKYSRELIDLRNKNREVLDNQSNFKTGINRIIDQTNQELQRKFTVARSKLISGLAAKVRETTGLRNISSPTNVYQNSNVGQYVLGKVGDFANLALGTALDKGTSYLNNLAKGTQNSIFDSANNGVNKLKGIDSINNITTDKNSPNSTDSIPNVYRRK